MTTQTFESGLKKEILIEARKDATTPEAGKQVAVHYTGWLEENGTQGRMFDSSVKRGTPLVFHVGVGQVIRGWDEGVMTMKEGEKARFTIPANLGYGARGAGAAIPPNATLIFDVELLKIG
ncbi:TPA: peptidylprolyl isomerase [Candidatus Dependentiae bacterium]|nr:peptidylprolyl isomerase [Candidatus Dependentiae bacterium]